MLGVFSKDFLLKATAFVPNNKISIKVPFYNYYFDASTGPLLNILKRDW